MICPSGEKDLQQFKCCFVEPLNLSSVGEFFIN